MSLSALLAAAKAEPDSDLPRLVLADWLDENGSAGERARAELIRVQCELARWVPDLARRTVLQKREAELVASLAEGWPLGSLGVSWRFERGLLRLELDAARFVTKAFAQTVAAAGGLWEWVESLRLTGISAHVQRVAASPLLPSVAQLDLAGEDLTPACLRRLLRSKGLGSLVSLALANNRLAGGALGELAESGLPGQLHHLDLRNNPFTEASAQVFPAPVRGWVDFHGLGVGSLAWVGQRPGRRVNSISMDFAHVPAGTFLMGSLPAEPDFQTREAPRHEIEITRPFWLAVYPVTQAQYERVMGHNPSTFRQGEGARHRPVENVNWDEAQEFCARLADLTAEREAGRRYRLPTEAGWEHACRAGTTTPFWFGDRASSHVCNFDGQGFGPDLGPFLQTTTPVGRYPANPFGLHDMVGNVWEWCSDWYGPRYYSRSPRQDPPGPKRGTQRIIRGGCWNGAGQSCRSARRLGEGPLTRDFVTGFRVVLVEAEADAGAPKSMAHKRRRG